MPRNMSYRKPVPKYIPSPPLSPSTEHGQLNLEETFGQEVPPLPREWREAIEQALSSDNFAASTLICGSLEGTDIEPIHVYSPNPSRRATFITRGSVCSAAWQCREEKQQRQPHHIYRPPTPPLPSYRPKRRRTDFDEYDWWDSCTTLPDTSRMERTGSIAMRLQRSGSTSKTIVATPTKGDTSMTFVDRKSGFAITTTSRGVDQTISQATWVDTLKTVCGVLVTKLEKGMKWLRC